jgi:hypothetical protein
MSWSLQTEPLRDMRKETGDFDLCAELNISAQDNPFWSWVKSKRQCATEAGNDRRSRDQYRTLDADVNSFAYRTYEDLQHPVDNTVDTAASSHTAAGLFTAFARYRGALLCGY